MPQIFFQFNIEAGLDKVFHAITSPEGLDQWWTKSSSGSPSLENTYEFNFGPGYDWTAVVSKCIINEEFEWLITTQYPGWYHTRVGFVLQEKNGKTSVNFYHTDWPEDNEAFRVSSYCWAMYLRILKRYVEFGETVAYEKRLSV